MKPSSQTIIIHGNEWKLTDIKLDIDWCRNRHWKQDKWTPSDALTQKSGTTSKYAGQRFDPTKYTLIKNGWNHDHCSICWWTLHESDNPAEATGWKDDQNNWLCNECHQQFIERNDKYKAEQAGPAYPPQGVGSADP